LIGDRILLTNLDFQSRNAKITRFWNRVENLELFFNHSLINLIPSKWSSPDAWLMFSWHSLQHGLCLRLYALTAGWPQQSQKCGKRESWKLYFDYFGITSIN